MHDARRALLIAPHTTPPIQALRAPQPQRPQARQRPRHERGQADADAGQGRHGESGDGAPRRLRQQVLEPLEDEHEARADCGEGLVGEVDVELVERCEVDPEVRGAAQLDERRRCDAQRPVSMHITHVNKRVRTSHRQTDRQTDEAHICAPD